MAHKKDEAEMMTNMMTQVWPVARLEAEKWASPAGWNVEAVEKEAKLVFSKPNGLSFYVLCSDKIENWNVWSDHDKVLEKMDHIQDFVHSCKKKTLTDILNYIDEKVARPPKPKDEDEAFDDDEGDDDDLDDDDDDVDDGIDDYYDEEDMDAISEPLPRQSSEEDKQNERFFTGKAAGPTIHRLLKDLKNLQSSQGKFGVEGTPRGDDLLTWDVKLTDLPEESLLKKDIDQWAHKYKREPVIYMEMEFPPDYPMAPPFVRVIRPRFRFLTGHVTIGGSVCMEMLTKSGWRPTNDIESIMVQIRAEIMSDNNARLDTSNPDRPYDKQEALTAFSRMVQRYGWNN